LKNGRAIQAVFGGLKWLSLAWSNPSVRTEETYGLKFFSVTAQYPMMYSGNLKKLQFAVYFISIYLFFAANTKKQINILVK
jgi:hypothetical protein